MRQQSSRRAFRAAGALALALTACAAIAGTPPAQRYPVRPVRMVVPFPPGGSTDIMARVIAQKLGESLGQQVVVDNRSGGAGGIIGTDLAAKAAPDGYTLLVTTSITHTAGASLHSKLPFDPVRDFAPITMAASAPLMLVVHPGVPAKTVKELIALAKARPGQLNYASFGTGTSGHLAAEMFKTMAGVNIVHVPYKGGGPATRSSCGTAYSRRKARRKGSSRCSTANSRTSCRRGKSVNASQPTGRNRSATSPRSSPPSSRPMWRNGRKW